MNIINILTHINSTFQWIWSVFVHWKIALWEVVAQLKIDSWLHLSQLPHDIAALIISTQIVDSLKLVFDSLMKIRGSNFSRDTLAPPLPQGEREQETSLCAPAPLLPPWEKGLGDEGLSMPSLGSLSRFELIPKIRLKSVSSHLDSKIRRKVKRYKDKGLSMSERRVRVSKGIFSYWLFAFKQNRLEYGEYLTTTLDKLRAAGVSEDDIDKVKQDNEKDYWREFRRQLVVYIVEIPLIKCVKRYFKIQP
jgi:hypothetical protein